MKELMKRALNKKDMDIDEHIKETIGISSLERNLGGIEFDTGIDRISSLEISKKIFQQTYVHCPINKKYDIWKRIKENIKYKGSRNILLISKSSISKYLLSDFLNEKDFNKKSSFYIGSGFIKDQHSTQYILKILNKIILQMEQNRVLFLNELDVVYPFLHDLFNQNFTLIGDKSYARIPIDNSNYTFSLVDDDFKCIVLIDEEALDKKDIPFLNRFEKHIISFEYFLNEDLIKASEEIYLMIKDLAKIHIQKNNFKISYDIKRLLVNCDKEEIKGIIYIKYKEYQKEKKKLQFQDLQDIILQKISLILPQDIILLMKYSGFEQKYNNVTDKIIQFYLKGEHNNFYNFIKKMENPKNIIYTFSSIDEPLLIDINEEFETKMFGKISKNNIKEILISSINGENELETEVDRIYLDEEDKNKIIVFKFNPYETDIMNYIINFLDNYIKEKNYVGENKNKQKAFIFTVHMNRIFDEDKKDIKKKKYIEKNEFGEIISHISDFYQVFIDNLNGDDISIIDIMKYRDEELFRKCINVDAEFLKKINKVFSNFNYNFIVNVRDINKNNYPIKVIEYLKKNKDLRESIIKSVLKQKFDNKGILIKFLKEYHFTRDDIGITSIFQKYLSELFTENLIQFVFKTEKDHFLSTFIYNQFYVDINIQNKENNNEEKKKEDKKEDVSLINEEKKDENKVEENKNINYMNNHLVGKLIEVYLDKQDISKITNFKNIIKSKNINLLLGLKLPGIYSTLDFLRNCAKNELSDIKDIKDLYLDEKEDNFIKNINIYKSIINNGQKRIETEINKNELFQKIIDFGKEYQEDYKQFCEWILDDYYLLFLSETLKDIKNSFYFLEDYKNILKKMIYLRFNFEKEDKEEEIDHIKLISMKIVWLESNYEYISILLHIYQKLSNYEKNLFTKIDKIIENNELKYEISERVSALNKEFNYPFFYIMESILKIIITDTDIYAYLKVQDYYDFINILKGVVQDALKMVRELNIFSKEIFTIQQFLEIEDKLDLANKNNSENFLKVLHILSEHSKCTNDIISNGAIVKEKCYNIQILQDLLKYILGNTDNYLKLIINIFVYETKKVYNSQYYKILLNIILGSPNLIPISYPFMKALMRNYIFINPRKILKNLENIRNYQNLNIESNNDCLNEILLNIYENKFNQYFNLIPKLSSEDLEQYYPKYFEYIKIHDKVNPTYILFDTSLELFKNCAYFLEGVYNNRRDKKDEKINNENLCILYCISYIKIYLNKCIYFNHINNQEFSDFDIIHEALEGNSKNNNFRKVMKIYAFKILFYLLNSDYHELVNYHYSNHQIKFYEEFKDELDKTNQEMLSFYLLPSGDKFNKYEEELNYFQSYRFSDFDSPEKRFKDFIENHGIDIFYCVSSNIIISNLGFNNFLGNSNEYSKYSSFIKRLFDNKLKLPEITKKLFLLYSNKDEFNKTMKKKLMDDEGLTEINLKTFEILLYSLRFCLKTSNCQNPDGYLYSQLITNDCEKKISENCIPGNNILDDIFFDNFAEIEKNLNILPSNYGVYVCSCGIYYVIGPNGFPSEKSECLNCGKDIGGQGNILVNRPGHYRIFKDLAQKQIEFELYQENDQNIPNMILEEYKAKIIEPKIENYKFGISKVTKLLFENTHLQVRKLSQTGFRLLNFILYSHLFYANCLDFINNENMKKYVCEGMSCIKMIEINWNLLKNTLQSKGIIIQIFMNLIFNKLSEKLKNCKEIKTLQERENFEDEIEKLLEEAFKEYEEYSKKYLELNQEALYLTKHSMKSLMLEMNDIKEYDEENYPFYKYFFMTTYPSRDSFINELKKVIQYEIKNPLLASYINQDIDKINILKYLPDFNEFVNFMIDNYSYKISRKEASKKILKDEEIYKNNVDNFRDKFNKFKKIWKIIKPHAIKYGCREEMPPIDLDENQTLAYFLNDNGEIGKGMYIAAAYQYFIECQNNFMNKLIEIMKQKGILHHFIKNMEKTINIQKAKKNEVLNFDSANREFIDIIYDNCKRNIFREDNRINYMNYKQYIYDFDSIEKNLGELILPGKVKFNSHEKLNFVTYYLEGFRGNKSYAFSDFLGKYKQRPLNIKTKKIIYNYIKDKLDNKNEDLYKIVSSIQLLIYYLTQERKKETDEINGIIYDLPDNITLSNECIEFLVKLNLRVFEIEGLYSVIELLCFKLLINHLGEYYKKKIEKKNSEEILKLFHEKKISSFDKIDLASACRKLILRYLISTRDDIDYSEKNHLELYLEREEIWGEKWKNNEENIKKDLEILKKQELKLGNIYELYNLLGGEDEMKTLENLGVNKANKNEEEDYKAEEIKVVQKSKRKW